MDIEIKKWVFIIKVPSSGIKMMTKIAYIFPVMRGRGGGSSNFLKIKTVKFELFPEKKTRERRLNCYFPEAKAHHFF